MEGLIRPGHRAWEAELTPRDGDQEDATEGSEDSEELETQDDVSADDDGEESEDQGDDSGDASGDSQSKDTAAKDGEKVAALEAKLAKAEAKARDFQSRQDQAEADLSKVLGLQQQQTGQQSGSVATNMFDGMSDDDMPTVGQLRQEQARQNQDAQTQDVQQSQQDTRDFQKKVERAVTGMPDFEGLRDHSLKHRLGEHPHMALMTQAGQAYFIKADRLERENKQLKEAHAKDLATVKKKAAKKRPGYMPQPQGSGSSREEPQRKPANELEEIIFRRQARLDKKR